MKIANIYILSIEIFSRMDLNQLICMFFIKNNHKEYFFIFENVCKEQICKFFQSIPIYFLNNHHTSTIILAVILQ